MNLKRQLLMVSVFTLILPWAGCEFIRETESALRIGQQQMLSGTARAIAESMQQYGERFPGQPVNDDHLTGSRLYAHSLDAAPTIDGYSDDWPIPATAFGSLSGTDGPIDYALGIYRNQLYLYARVADRNVVYRQRNGSIANTDAPFADRITLTSISPPSDAQEFVFSAEAPGLVVAYRVNRNGFRSEPLIRAIWQDGAGGYQLEARVPMSILGSHLGLSISNTDASDEEPVRQATFNTRYPGRLVTAVRDLQSVAESIVQPGMRLLVTDRDGWRIGEAGALTQPTSREIDRPNPWLSLIYGALVEEGTSDAFAEPDPSGRERQPYVNEALSGTAAAGWFRSPASGTAVVSVAEPVVVDGEIVGAIILQQGTDAILSLTNESLARLLNVTLVATVVVAALLLGYATWLSRRIRRLSIAAENALDAKVSPGQLPSASAGDEIGDLSRSFSNVLVQLGEYNEYLRTLASKLSHELRTPLAIVTSSLDNLEHEDLSDASARYTARAKDGADRLRKILAAMSEASRVEELVKSVEVQRVDLSVLVSQSVAAYRDIYPEREFVVEAEPDVAADVAPELIVQMLDKLVDNAVDFSAVGEAITLSVKRDDDRVLLGVHNRGPKLPESMRDRLFDSMISVRDADSDEHLGLGLHIAKIIAEAHRAEIAAENVNDGVLFTVHLWEGLQPR